MMKNSFPPSDKISRRSFRYFLFVLKRDLGALRQMGQMAYGWLVVGRKVRRRYKSHIEDESTYWIDKDDTLR